MRYLIIISFLFFISCQKKATHPVISMPIDKYKLVSVTPDQNLNKFSKKYKRANNYFVMDFDSGEFYGKYQGTKYVGKYDIKKVTSGLTKGFNYQVSLVFLSKNVLGQNSNSDSYFDALTKATRIFVSPDRLIDSQYVWLRMGNDENLEMLKLYYLR
jgi:hypothetical protein